MHIADENYFWIDCWENNNYDFFDQQQVNVHLKNYLANFKLDEKDVCFVPFCGKSIDMIHLAKLKFNVIGVEISSKAIELFFHNNIRYTIEKISDDINIYKGNNITIIQADMFKLQLREYTKKIDFWYDRGSYISISNNLREKYASFINNATVKIKSILLISTYYDGVSNAPPYSIHDLEINTHFAKNYNIKRLYSKKSTDLTAEKMAKGRSFQYFNVDEFIYKE